MNKKMNKFEAMLVRSAQGVKATRAKRVAEGVSDIIEQDLMALKSKKRELEGKRDDITDIYPDSTLSTQVVKDGWDAKSWYDEISAIDLELANLEVELTLAEKRKSEFLGEAEKVEGGE